MITVLQFKKKCALILKNVLEKGITVEEQKEKTENASEEATTVGMFLKYTRMKQKKSIEAVSDALCIRKIYIKALEEDDYETLAPIPYGVGFVRSYASYLGLNAERIAQIYKEQALPQKEKPTPAVVKKQSEMNMPTRRQIYIGLIAIVAIYILWLLTSWFKSDGKNEPSKQEQPQIIEVLPTNEDAGDYIYNLNEADFLNVDTNNDKSDSLEEQIQVVDGEYAENPSPLATKSRVEIKVKGDSWIELKDKDKVYLSGTYKKGFEYAAPDVSGLILSVGRYYNVDVYIDGQLTKVATPKKQTKIDLDKFIQH